MRHIGLLLILVCNRRPTLLLMGLIGLSTLGTTQAGAQIAIESIEALQSIGNAAEYPLDGNYVLVNDIEGADTANWNGGTGFVPIGGDAAPFSGTFDGQGFNVSNLSIDQLPGTFTGLFGVIGPEGVVENLRLVDAAVYGYENLGGLAGWNAGTISACFFSGLISCGGENVGGLVGWNVGTVSACSVSGEVSGGTGNIGGLVGYNEGSVSGSDSSADVYCGYGNVGGLVGLNHLGVVSMSYSTGGVSCGYGSAGGLVGWNAGTLRSSSAGSVVTGEGSIGGLAGTNKHIVAECYATGVATCGYGSVGGLVGWNRLGSVTASYAGGLVSGGYFVAGLVGMNDEGLVASCYSTGTVLGNVSDTGGSVGWNSGTVETSMWDTETSMTSVSDGGMGQDTKAMKTQGTYSDAGWNFATVWYMHEGVSYPYLRNVAFAISPGQEAWRDAKAPLSCHAASTEEATGRGDLTTLLVVFVVLAGVALRLPKPQAGCGVNA